MYLMIQNKGVAPIEAFTLLGLSGSRESSTEGVIGQFGSGTKHAINLLLRKGVEFYIYAGPNKLTFSVEGGKINDSVSDIETERVVCKVSGKINRTIQCGWDVKFGELDWTSIDMGLREFVSNALDITSRSEDPMHEEALIVDTVLDTSVRAKSGHTRIFVKIEDGNGVDDFHRQLDDYFLHFSSPDQLKQTFIVKNCAGGSRVYREGVFVRQLKSIVPAVFDYNLRANEIDIDESRTSNEYALKATIARKINLAPVGVLEYLFECAAHERVYEGDLDSYYLSYTEGADNWKTAWENFAEGAIATADEDGYLTKYAKSRGHRTKAIKSVSLYSAAAKMGITTVGGIASQQVLNGFIQTDPSEQSKVMLDRVWGAIGDGEQPLLEGFRVTTDADAGAMEDSRGNYGPGDKYVSIHDDLGGRKLLETTILLAAQYMTQEEPDSSEVRDSLIKIIANLI